MQQHLSPHAAVMPVLDVADDWTWYVMPLALGNLQELREQLDDAELLRAIDSAAWGLQAAHERGYSHRDVTPRNILALPDNSAPAGRRWVIADFGLVRRPPGQTTAVLTRSGQVIGTGGFVAPEMLRDSALNAGSAPDVYGLGRVAAWATTGTWPPAGEDLLPSGRWRAFVRAATNRDPRRRVSDMTAFREMLPGVASTQEAVAPTVQAAALLAGHFPLLDTEDAAARVIGLALEHRDDTDLYFDHLVEVRGEPIVTLVADDPNDALALAEKMRDHLAPPGSLWGERPFGSGSADGLNRPLMFIHEVVRAAVAIGNIGLLEDLAAVFFETEIICHRYGQRQRTRTWLENLRGEAAEAVARAARATPGLKEWHGEGGGWRPSSSAHPAVRAAMD